MRRSISWYALALAALGGPVSSQDDTGWRPLFSGRNLDGWDGP
jgi:hypothetical protein